MVEQLSQEEIVQLVACTIDMDKQAILAPGQVSYKQITLKSAKRGDPLCGITLKGFHVKTRA
ncbi:uncharacterized protein J3R85_019039 [Psidium guajava]|nr:uncharacterized protein J3R85_019039 [Psidium guajava]